jgi:hypothetical protein
VTSLILDFSGTYGEGRFPRTYSSGERGQQEDGTHFICLDLEQEKGFRSFADPARERRLSERLRAYGPRGIHFLDDGDFHHVSAVFLGMLREPFELMVFDHHTDMQPSAFGNDLLTCGSWVREVLLHNPNLSLVTIAGPPAASFAETDGLDPALRAKIHGVTAEECRDLSADPARAGTLPLYLSVDKDILRRGDAVTNWDQGDFTLEELLSLIRKMTAGRRIIGADICGGLSPEEESDLPEEIPEDEEYGDPAEINERSDRALFETIRALPGFRESAVK